jgi:phosphomannomutase/phosphoglucomutase
MKRRVKETGALAGFEKSGHYFLAGDIGRGFDCGLRVAVEVCRMLDRHPDLSLADIHAGLPKSYSSPTMSLHCPDDQKYQVSQRITAKLQALQKVGAPFAGRQIADIVTVNGCRVQLEDGGWALVRPSSNTPTLVVVCESQKSVDDLKAVFSALDAVIRTEPSTGAYDQTI